MDPAKFALAILRANSRILLYETTGPGSRTNYIIFYARKKPPFGNFIRSTQNKPITS